MAWMVGIGQGIRCGNENNQYRVFVDEEPLKLPSIPGVAEKCELFEFLHNKKIIKDK